MFLHLNHHDAVHAERRRHHEQEAVRWRLARAARPTAEPVVTLGVLLDEAGEVLDGGLLDRDDGRDAVLLEALVSELVAAAARCDADAAVLAPRQDEPPIVAIRALAGLARRTAARAVPVDARRAVVVRGLLEQMGAGPAPHLGLGGARPDSLRRLLVTGVGRLRRRGPGPARRPTR